MKTDDGLILSSITYALRARQILAGYGLTAYVQRLSASVTGSGCGYGLRLADPSQLNFARQIVSAAGILVKGTFSSHDLS